MHHKHEWGGYRHSVGVGRKVIAFVATFALMGGFGSLLVVGPLAYAATGPASQATAQVANINLLNGTAAVDVPSSPTSATNDGTDSNAPVVGNPLLSALSGEHFLTAGALADEAEANSDGTSYGCAGLVSPNGGIQVGSKGDSCSATGTNTGGVTVNISTIPGIGSALSSIADVKVTLNSMVAFAHDTAGSTPTGLATLAGAKVSVKLLSGLLPTITVPLTLSGSPNENLLTAIVNSLTSFLSANPLDVALDPVISALSDSLKPILSLETNYQKTTPSGAFEVSALHIALLKDAGAVANLAEVTVGPNRTPVVTPAPVIAANGITPTSGPTTGGTTVTITGTDLGNASAVDFGAGNPATIVSDTATQVVVKDPAHAAGAVTVTVTTPGGTSNGKTFSYTAVTVPSVPMPVKLVTGPPIAPANHTDALPLGLSLSVLGITGLGYLVIDRKHKDQRSTRKP